MKLIHQIHQNLTKIIIITLLKLNALDSKFKILKFPKHY